MTAGDAGTTVDAEGIAGAWFEAFGAAAAQADAAALGTLFLADAYWRDVLALTWDLRWAQGADAIGARLAEGFAAAGATGFRLDDAATLRYQPDARGGSIEAFYDFETGVGRCRGYLRLRPSEASPVGWQGWMILTALVELRGLPEAVGHHRPSGLVAAGQNWSSRRRAEVEFRDRDPQAVVIGAGHAGLGVAARLGRLAVDTLVLERLPRVGDGWRNRYGSLYLHNEVWMNHLPYLDFPPSWPLFTPKDKLADWLEFYATAMDLNVWTSSSLEQADYDDTEKRWHLRIRRGDEVRDLTTPHVVLATGIAGEARRLRFDGVEDFGGEVVHSQDYREGRDVRGRRVLVIGTGSSAHDIARDCVAGGAEVTMLQRSSTTVLSVSPGAGLVYSRYHEGAGPLEDLDLSGMAAPLPLVAELQKDVTRRVAELDADLLAGLSRAGFRTDSGEDGGGMLMKFYGRGGGYYIDVGCSQLIIDGRIAVKQGVEVARLRPGEVVFTDGDTLLADLVVVAAGFGNMQDVIRTLFGAAVADRVGPVWGIGQDGELRGMWRRTGQPGLWITGSSFTQSRTMSRPLALQIAAQQRGMLPLAVPHDGSGMPRRGQEIRDQIETDSDVGSIDT